MTLSRLDKAPFPYFGGKSDAAEIVWAALGDPAHYVEPFMGSLVTLLRRPSVANRPYFSETVNDLDGLLVNAWRAIQFHPQAVAEAAAWPVTEADLTARHLAIVRWQSERDLLRLMADPEYCDPKIAGWWVWGLSAWIGGGWCTGDGPWVADADGRLVKRPSGTGNGVSKRRPHMTGNGSGVNTAAAREPGVSKQLPNVNNNGIGVNTAAAREPGVSKQLPHVSGDGLGVNTQTAREPGVSKQLPNVSGDGRGVNTQTARELGVNKKLPHVSGDGRGVNTQTAREPGVSGEPESGPDDWQAQVLADYAATDGYHPMTMPEVRRWFHWLAARLRHVRILSGDWRRALTGSVVKTITVRMGDEVAGVFLDPPYGAEATRAEGLYTTDSLTVAAEVREWCAANGADPKLRIVLAGFDGEHNALEAQGWRVVEWFRGGFLKGGMAQRNVNGHQQGRERLWLSPHCLDVTAPAAEPEHAQLGLFGGAL